MVRTDPEREEERAADRAKREVVEEAGYEAVEMTFLIEGPPSSGITSERVVFFRATGLKKVGLSGGDPDKEIQIHEVPVDRVAAWLHEANRRGKLVDPKTYIALYFLATQGDR